MLAYKAESTIFMPTSSLMAWNKPKMCLGGTKKNVYIGGNDPKCTKSVTNMKNGILTNWKPRQPDMMHDILCGRLVQDELVFQQELVVRSFDIGSDSKMSIVALANYLRVLVLLEFLWKM